VEATTVLAVQEGFIEHIKLVLDAYVAVYPSISSISYAIKDRQGGTNPIYPYIVVEKITTANSGSWLRDTFVEDGKVYYVSEQKLTLSVSCYGDESDDILNILKNVVNDDIVRLKLNELTGARFQYYEEIEDSPKYLNTDFIQGSTVEGYFTMLTKFAQFAPYESGTIEGLKGEGIAKDAPIDEAPIIIPINI